MREMSIEKLRCKPSLHFIQSCFDSSTISISKFPFKGLFILVLKIVSWDCGAIMTVGPLVEKLACGAAALL